MSRTNVYRSNGQLVLTDGERDSIYGTSQPRRNKQINSVKAELIRGTELSIESNSYLYGPIKTDLIIEKQITTENGANLVINPSGPSVDFTGHTLINVGGISVNPNRYEVVSPAFVTTIDATPTVLLTITTSTGFAYTIRTDVAISNVTVGSDSCSVIITTNGKNPAGTAGVIAPYITLQRGGDASLNGISVYYTISGSNILVMGVGLAATTIRWLAAASITRTSF